MAGGQIYSGLAANAEGKSAENMSRYNAAMQEREAQQIEQQTAAQQKLQAEQADRQMSTMRAGLGASGAVTTEGAPLLIQSTQAIQNEYDNMMTGYQGSEQALAARSQGQLDLLQGKIDRTKGKNAMYSSFIGAGSSLLTGFGKSGMFDKPTGISKNLNTGNGFGTFNSRNFGPGDF
jgi:uncharacterized protein YqkB